MTSKTATETGNNAADPKAATNNSETPAEEKDVDLKNKEVGGGDGEEVKSPTAEDGAGKSPASKKAPKAPKATVHKVDYEKDTVYLYQFTRCPVIPSASPFCFKVETWLRMTAIKYENVDHRMKFKSKKGQLPFVELNGKEIADSDIIIKELSKHFSKDIDEGLTEEQRNISHAFESMLNNHTSWVVRWWRYNNPGDFINASQLDIKKTLNSRIPKSLLDIMFKMGFRSNVKHVVGQGLGRHTNEEIYDFGKSDLKSLSQQLGTNDYFFGKEPHLLDCNAFAHLCQFVFIPFEGMKEWIETETPNLMAFVTRMKDRYWSDWTEACETLELNTHLPKKEPTEDEKKAEEAKEEAKKKKEELKKQKEEQKKELAEKKKKEKEEKEQKKKEAKEKAEREKKEKAEKEKAEKEEKEKKEKEEKEKKEKEAEEAKAAKEAEDAKTKESDAKTTSEEAEKKEEKKVEEEKKE